MFRCNPNPCEHGGICMQDSKDFYCECEHTGYAGMPFHIYRVATFQFILEILKFTYLCK